jgi:putative salt-induced outer membrane protein
MRSAFRLAMMAGLLLPFALGAETAEGPWSGSFALGYVAVGGNSDSESVNVRGELGFRRDRWRHLLTASAVGASQDDETTAEAYRAVFTSQYDLTERVFVFGTADYSKDKFSGFDRQISETAGLGWRVLNTPTHELDLSIGAGARQSKLRDGSSDNEAVGRAGVRYAWQISETASFGQTLDVVSGSDNTTLESQTDLRAAIVGNLAMTLGYNIKRNTSVPPDSRNTDTLATVALEYKF